MDKAFKVFVSSTFIDLEGEREEIKNNIDNISLESIGMESFVPSENDGHKTSLDELGKSHIYLLLIGEEYGTKIEKCRIDCDLKNSVCDGNISYTRYIHHYCSHFSSFDHNYFQVIGLYLQTDCYSGFVNYSISYLSVKTTRDWNSKI